MNCSLRTDAACEESRPWKSPRPSGHLSKRDGGRDWKRHGKRHGKRGEPWRLGGSSSSWVRFVLASPATQSCLVWRQSRTWKSSKSSWTESSSSRAGTSCSAGSDPTTSRLVSQTDHRSPKGVCDLGLSSSLLLLDPGR